jgi:4-hydroxybenzoate polyprenyltransferase
MCARNLAHTAPVSERALAVVRVEPPARRSLARAALVSMRPRQWAKNLLLFAGILFAAKIGDLARWLEAFGAFVAYCSASSAAYLINDLRDVEADRAHPLKRSRPIARGELDECVALMLAGALAALALAIAVVLGPASVGLLVAFVALQVAYTLGLKHVAIVDVFMIAGLFIVRGAAGAVAVDVSISGWLLVCTGLLALFLALGKRRAELVLVQTHRTLGRQALDGYSLALVDQLIAAVAGATIMAYTAYTLVRRDSHALVATIPFVVFGVFRYILLLHRRGLGEEPENVLLGDWPILATVAVWAVVCGAILVH